MSLTSERLIYKKCDSSHLEDYLKFGMNEAVMRYVTYRLLTRDEAIERFGKALVINIKNTDLGYWLAYNKADGSLVAYLKIVNIGNNQHEVGYLVLPEYWGQKYASELTAALVVHARKLESVVELVGIVDVENGASKGVLLKQEFELYDTGMLDGKPVEYFRMKI